MKRICITTFQNAHNYGAILQAFALSNVITNLNKNNYVELLNYSNKKITRGYKLFTPIRKNLFECSFFDCMA